MTPVKLTVEYHDNTNERHQAYMRGWYCVVEGQDGIRNSRQCRDFDEAVTYGATLARRMMAVS